MFILQAVTLTLSGTYLWTIMNQALNCLIYHRSCYGAFQRGAGSGSNVDLSRPICLYTSKLKRWSGSDIISYLIILFNACCVEPHARPHGSRSEIQIPQIRFQCPCGTSNDEFDIIFSAIFCSPQTHGGHPFKLCCQMK